mmetsp:Transcript_17714/g.41553  ORF Transcript_17714/g.41553 Transcript_17714/m.41553 type:complete len:220 (-) Transcript_17714:367-1026(-)
MVMEPVFDRLRFVVCGTNNVPHLRDPRAVCDVYNGRWVGMKVSRVALAYAAFSEQFRHSFMQTGAGRLPGGIERRGHPCEARVVPERRGASHFTVRGVARRGRGRGCLRVYRRISREGEEQFVVLVTCPVGAEVLSASQVGPQAGHRTEQEVIERRECMGRRKTWAQVRVVHPHSVLQRTPLVLRVVVAIVAMRRKCPARKITQVAVSVEHEQTRELKR